MTEQLKPCPFCKAEPYPSGSFLGDYEIVHYDRCYLLTALSPWHVILTEDLADWNRRAEPQE